MRSCIILAAILFCAQSSHAGLGQSLDTVAKDKQMMSLAQESQVSQNKYDIHQIYDDRTKVREYVNRQGVVFGVGWDAKNHPNLHALLGNYFSEYQEAFKERRSKMPYRRPSMSLETKHLIVKMGGHFGAIHGSAYVRSLVPQGVSVDDIK